MEKATKYLAPTVKVVAFRIERGFQTSDFKEQSPNESLNPPDGNGEVMGHNDWGTL